MNVLSVRIFRFLEVILNCVLEDLFKGCFQGGGEEFFLLTSLEVTARPCWAYQQYTCAKGQGKGQAGDNCPL
jgi:hypothetical protein